MYKKDASKRAMVDDEDFETVSKHRWHEVPRGYARTYIGREGIFMHRMVAKPPRDKVIDHKDRNKLNNCKANLRVCTQAQNCRNVGALKNNKSGLKGVSWYRKSRKWKAEINLNKKVKWLGLFNTKEEASEAYKKAALQLHGEFARW